MSSSSSSSSGPRTHAQEAAVKRFHQAETELGAFLDEQVKLGADGRSVSVVKTKLQEARLWAVEAFTGHLNKYKAAEVVAVAAAPVALEPVTGAAVCVGTPAADASDKKSD